MAAFFKENDRVNPLAAGVQWSIGKEALVTYSLMNMRPPDEELCGQAVTLGGVYREDLDVGTLQQRWAVASGKVFPEFLAHGTTIRNGLLCWQQVALR